MKLYFILGLKLGLAMVSSLNSSDYSLSSKSSRSFWDDLVSYFNNSDLVLESIMPDLVLEKPSEVNDLGCLPVDD
jgi:hypothetical protein